MQGEDGTTTKMRDREVDKGESKKGAVGLIHLGEARARLRENKNRDNAKFPQENERAVHDEY